MKWFFPAYKIAVVTQGQKKLIFDKVRKKYVVLTPEEWVRQHLIHYLIEEKGVPPGLISVERSVQVNGQYRRTDLVVYDTAGKVLMVCECKAPEINLTQKAINQVAHYNFSLKSPWLLLTNGHQIYFCRINFVDNSISAIADLGSFPFE